VWPGEHPGIPNYRHLLIGLPHHQTVACIADTSTHGHQTPRVSALHELGHVVQAVVVACGIEPQILRPPSIEQIAP